MSYKNDKEQMNNEMSLHKKRVMLAIKITFLVLAVALVSFAISFAIGLGKGDLFASQRDTEPPTISAREGTTVIGYLGESPTFKKYVLVSDDKDEEPKLAIDSKSVNTEKEGSYTVYYQAKDSAGNKSAVFSLTYVVKNNEYSRDALMKKIAKLAGDLGISKDMSTVEKVRKIYKFVNQEIGWSGGIGESNIPGIDRDNWKVDWIEEAIRTLELWEEDDCEGDCYSYYSLSKAFFEYFEIKHIGIRRDKSLDNQEDSNGDRKGTHFWQIVDIGGGKWYFYDATQLAQGFNDGTKNACLITQEKLSSHRTSSGGDYFYKISKASDCLDFSSAGINSYPKIATETLD